MISTDDWGKDEFRQYAQEIYEDVVKLIQLGLSGEDRKTCAVIFERLRVVNTLMKGKLTRRVREKATEHLEWADNETAIVMLNRFGQAHFREPGT